MANGASDKLSYADRAAVLAIGPYKIFGSAGSELVFRHVNNTSQQFYIANDTELRAKAAFIENWRGDKNLPTQ